MPETMSVERRKLLVAFGANLCSPTARGHAGRSAKAEEMVASDPDRYVLLQQFQNPANPGDPRARPAPKSGKDTQGTVDVLVSGIGTGGTITGVSRYIKTRGKPIAFGGVEPVGSPVITQHRRGQPLNRARTRSRASAPASFPGLWISPWSTASSWSATKNPSNGAPAYARRRHPAGIAARAAAAVAARVAKRPRKPAKPSS